MVNYNTKLVDKISLNNVKKYGRKELASALRKDVILTFTYFFHFGIILRYRWKTSPSILWSELKITSSWLLFVSNRFNHSSIFSSIWNFFHEHWWIRKLQGKGEGIFLTPHYHFHSLHRHLGISRAITVESSPLRIAFSRIELGTFSFRAQVNNH